MAQLGQAFLVMEYNVAESESGVEVRERTEALPDGKRPGMIENEPITITSQDVHEANQLSLHCPICANPVENHVRDSDLKPVICQKCGTLYHLACWEQSGGKCAILGCGSEKYRPFGQPDGPIMKITYDDLPADRGRGTYPNGQQKRLKEEERRRARQQWDWLPLWLHNLLRAIKILE
jgi:hypothetical protein